MYRFSLLLIAVIIGFFSIEYVFAEWCDIKVDLPDSATLRSQVIRCIDARSGKSWETPNSITDFVCPQGDFFDSNNQPITAEILSYLIAVNLSYNKVDLDIQKYMRQLQKTREPNPAIWIETIKNCTEKIASIYDNICTFWVLESKLNEGWGIPIITTTNTYPQVLCRDTANKKIQWWKYLQNIMMSDGISKNQKNSTDKWATEVKWAYARVLGSWHTYQKILARAVSKMTGYNKQIVK